RETFPWSFWPTTCPSPITPAEPARRPCPTSLSEAPLSRPTRAVVDLSAIGRNFRSLSTRVAPARVLPVVKADAYGHGAVAVARRLAAEGAGSFAVAIADEGAALRRAGLSGGILVLNYSAAAEVPLLRAYGLTPTL